MRSNREYAVVRSPALKVPNLHPSVPWLRVIFKHLAPIVLQATLSDNHLSSVGVSIISPGHSDPSSDD